MSTRCGIQIKGNMKLRNFLSCTVILIISMLFVVSACNIKNNQNNINAAQMDSINVSIAKFDSTLVYSYIFEQPDTFVSQYVITQEDTIECKKDSLYAELMDEVHCYIYKQSPRMASVLSKHIVDIALENEFDICFMLAQAKLETTFGKHGSGKTRKSVFGVNKRYSSYEHCISDYVDIVKKKYLGKHKTEQHLLHNYVTLRGNCRYAGNKNYETELKNVYNQILAKTDIKRLQNEICTL